MNRPALSEIAENLRLSSEGIWVAGGHATLFYPEDARNRILELEDGSWWFRHRNAAIEALFEVFPPAGPVFDLGGGNGSVALALQRAGHCVVLVEPSPVGARNALSRGVEDVVCATVEEARFRSGVLPAVGLFDVIEHIENDTGFLRDLWPRIASGGCLYLTVPAHPWLWSPEDDYSGHQRRYTGGSLRRTLRAAGFELEYLSYLFALLPVPVWLLRALPGRLGLRRTDPADRVAGHLRVRLPLLDQALRALQALEVRRVQRGRRIPLGASLLAVARKPI